MLITLSLAIMLPAAGNEYSIHKVEAESLSDIKNKKESTLPMQASTQRTEQEILNHQSNFLIINKQMKLVSTAIQANNQEIKKIINDNKQAQTEVKQLEKEIRNLKKDINKRKNVLRDRARAYQQSGKHVTYVDVLLGATSFSDFVERVCAVAAIAEADQNLLEQQEKVQQEYNNKKSSLEMKLIDLSNKKNKLETLRANLKKQENEYEMLREEHKKEKVQTHINVSSENVGEYISTVINAGNKYIGNSDYVFGAGRNAFDVAHGRFDCSGFVHWAFAQAGIKIGSSTSTIKNDGRQVSPQEMQPGDLVFFDTYKKDGHVGIYLGDGKFIGSQRSTGVAIADMTKGYWKNTFKGRVVRI
ncbi:NlpC/P60 family protein [Neobacillus drentensis]|uniref:C40 family peptidase n=1 Tax=Neobacillus drentensis TaxID=220684 RepID=UPI0030005DBF